MMKAIETRYQGYRFRSRLEARWAVFFDYLSIPWEYEPDGVSLGERAYLPDFRLWGELYAEVKPLPREREEARGWLQTLHAFAEKTQQSITLLIDAPMVTWYPIVTAGGPDWIDFGMSSYKARPWYSHTGKGRPDNETLVRVRLFDDAVDAARGARFEHGETPR